MVDAPAPHGDAAGTLPADLAAAVALGGEMGARFAVYDWASHPLGEPSTWPPHWRSAVAVALTSRIPIVLWFGPELYLVYNDAYIAILGEKHPAALGRRGEQVWWDIWEPISPMLAGVMATGQATWSDDLMLALVSAGRPIERYFSFTYGPLVASDGAVDGVFCAVTETTEKVLGERRLRLLTTMAGQLFQTRTVAEALSALASVCDGTHPDVPFVAVYTETPDHTGTLAAASSTVRTRLPDPLVALASEEEAIKAGQQPLVLDLLERAPQLVAAFEGKGPEQALLIRLGDTALARGHLLLGLNPNRPLDNLYRGFCGLVADQVSAALTAVGSLDLERRRADALAQLDQAKNAFLTNVSHEFRTPLTLLLGPLEDAIAAEDDETRREPLQTAHRNARRLLRLVSTLLEFARTEAGRAQPEPVHIDVGTLTAHIASSFTELCRQAGIELVLNCDPVMAEVDPQMWETVVLNLLSNAVKFTFEGRITVTAERAADGTAAITVADTGTGITREDLPRLFERFYRARAARARSIEGTGIGLSLVRSLVELHGGTISIDSTVNVGTSVSIVLPAPRQAVAVATVPTPPTSDVGNAYVAEALQWLRPAEPSAGSDTTPGERPLVLVVDDNPDMRRYLRGICSQHWDVAESGDGDDALRMMRERPPDLVVADVMMPALDGLGLVAAIRADPRLAPIPVVLLSARAGVEASGAGLSAGADDYLPKPFNAADLVNRIAARLRASARESEQRVRDRERASRAAALAAFATALSAARSSKQVLTALLESPVALGASAACVGFLEESGDIRVTYAGAVSADLREHYRRVPAGAPVPFAEVIRSAEPMIIPEVRELDRVYARFAEDAQPAVRAALLHPLRDQVGSVVGVLGLMWPRPCSFAPQDVEVAAQVALDAGQAIERIAMAEREHRIAIAFQEHQLELDRRSGVAVLSAVYQPAAEMMRVGGDWYLAAPLSETHRLAVSVGDAVGHGLQAATVMSRLRSAAVAAALTDPAPEFVVDLLERFAAHVPGAACTTVGYAVVDSASHTVEYVCAGHPYPLLVTEDGSSRYLTDGRRPPLTISPDTPSPAGRDRLPPGALLLLYTDGLIERPGEDLDEGFARLAAAAGRLAREPADAVCASLLETMEPPGGYRDDVALVAVRPAGTTESSFAAVYPAEAAGLAALRTDLSRWLAGIGVDGKTADDLLLTGGEAASIVAELVPRYETGQSVSVEVFADGEQLHASVSGAGRWHAESAHAAGLTLIRDLCEGVDIVRSARGTRLTMHHRLDQAPEPPTER